MSIWCSKGATAPCLNMVGQSMKTFPSHQSSHPEPGGRSLVDGGGSKGKEGERTFFLIKKKKKKKKKTPVDPSLTSGTHPPGRVNVLPRW